MLRGAFSIAIWLSFLALVLVGPVHAQMFETKASRAFMIEAETGTVLFSKNPDEPFPPASLAKLMTVEVVFNALKSGRLSPDETFYVSENAWRTGGAVSGTSTMFAEVKSSVPLEALVQGVIVQSANDGCIVIAEGMAGSEENFARLMTERARTLGLDTSTFVNSTGLPAAGQAVTAREMTQLALHIWREYPRYYGYFAQPDFEWNGIRQRNRNPLLPMDIGADGLKTGFTEESGYAIVASVERDGRRLFATLGGMESETERAEEARKMLDWGMRAFEKREVFAEGDIVGEASVYGGARGTVRLRAKGALSILVPTTEPERMSARIVYQGPIKAPVQEGEEVARLQIWFDETLSQETPLYTAESIDRGKLHERALDAVAELLVGWMR
ncbi:D-alanyl-D-alanine carboxypeptidase DacC [Nitratireductor thuwali]|uniref:serine-type D-Ala-D-Ala carboxypeptidase n=2 Tax=Nitratireductor thuwali TaxID=2267699 RepID=A0ABY5MQ96_9HYPH|nr:D-alanyl-D-alanine carboxypeptidase DacC [Nitratireductor thuwali]